MRRGSSYLRRLNAQAKKSKGGAGKNPHAVALGSKGGRLGGPARARALSKKRRTEIAVMGGKARQGAYEGNVRGSTQRKEARKRFKQTGKQ
jgi:hypothetical protein